MGMEIRRLGKKKRVSCFVMMDACREMKERKGDGCRRKGSYDSLGMQSYGLDWIGLDWIVMLTSIETGICWLRWPSKRGRRREAPGPRSELQTRWLQGGLSL